MSNDRILVFGGTKEGRQVSDYLSENRVFHTLCVATEYGEEVLTPSGFVTVRRGRMNRGEMCSLLQEQPFAAVVDATHPYAVEVSANIRAACAETALPCLRLLRTGGELNTDRNGESILGTDEAGSARIVRVNTAAEAADYLEKQSGRILLTTGSKELTVFTERISDTSRLFARVLPSAEVLASCRAMGLEGRQICAMQGPFSQEFNEAMLRQIQAAFLVTKDTGATGGFPEKVEAARRLGVETVVIRRPEETGYDWDGLKKQLARLIGAEIPSESCIRTGQRSGREKEQIKPVDLIRDSRQISCVGIGMGTSETLTQGAADLIRRADILFGAGRILESVQKMPGLFADDPLRQPTVVAEYRGQKISAYLAEHPQYKNIVILVSGDVGFYSGARSIQEAFPGENVQYCCGISSVVYFASRIPTAWQDAKLLSAHGRELSVLNCVRRYRKCILLVSGGEDVERICEELVLAGQDQVRVTAGTNLSYPDERIECGRPQEFAGFASRGGGLHILMLENPAAEHVVTPGIPDDKFVRGQVPMTKEEVRILSIAKLQLQEDSIVYDVGAGTGSISVEIARLCTGGRVYAIERNPEGINLIRANSRRLCVSNVTLVQGCAPQAMENLPVPTHAFIGGSACNMREILRALLQKNPGIRIVINAAALETLAEVTQLLQEFAVADADIVQVSAAKAKPLGRYHTMQAQNPVFVISFRGRETAIRVEESGRQADKPADSQQQIKTGG